MRGCPLSCKRIRSTSLLSLIEYIICGFQVLLFFSFAPTTTSSVKIFFEIINWHFLKSVFLLFSYILCLKPHYGLHFLTKHIIKHCRWILLISAAADPAVFLKQPSMKKTTLVIISRWKAWNLKNMARWG